MTRSPILKVNSRAVINLVWWQPWGESCSSLPSRRISCGEWILLTISSLCTLRTHCSVLAENSLCSGFSQTRMSTEVLLEPGHFCAPTYQTRRSQPDSSCPTLPPSPSSLLRCQNCTQYHLQAFPSYVFSLSPLSFPSSQKKWLAYVIASWHLLFWRTQHTVRTSLPLYLLQRF